MDKAAWSCVDFVLLKVFPCIDIVLKLLWDRKSTILQYGCVDEKGISGGEAIWCSFGVATIILVLLGVVLLLMANKKNTKKSPLCFEEPYLEI